MFHFSHKNSEPFFGLDISDQSLKIFQLKKHSDKTKIQSFGKYKLKEGVVVNGEIKKEEILINSIKELIAKPIFGSITTSNVVACLPEDKCFIKLSSIENSPNQTNDLVLAEIEKSFPFTLDKLYFDWQAINKQTDALDVLIASAPKPLVDSYIQVLQKAGLSVLAMETESISLCRSLIPENPKQDKEDDKSSYAIIDIGAVESSMVIYSKNSVVLSMNIDVSGEEITKNIAETLEINRSQAEKAKIICGLDKDKAEGIIHDILIKETTAMTKRIQSIIDFYNDHYPDYEPIKKIFISGGGSNVKNLKNVISDFLKIEVVDGNVFSKIAGNVNEYNKKFTEVYNIDYKLLKKRKTKSKKVKTISSEHNSSLNYATVIGLALRRV